MSAPPFNLEAVERSTVAAIAHGHRVFQTHRYADDDADQVAYLLDIMAPEDGAIVLDAGCGIGEVSRLMAEKRPDLWFVLANVSPLQLSLCPNGDQFIRVLGDCHALEFDAESFGAAMYSSALCQMDIPIALAEAYRLLKPGGVLLINDMARNHDDDGAMENAIAARVLKQAALIKAVQQAGFIIDKVLTPEFDDAHFRGLLENDGMGSLIDGIYPIIIRATKGAVAL